jgi:hypothetical protein
MRQEHESGLAEFLKPERRARFREALARDRSRKKLQRELFHFEHRLDKRYAQLQEKHTKHDEHVALVYDRLVEAGALDRCFVLLDDDRLDGEVPLKEALEDVMRVGAGFISCVPARLGAYVSEDGANVFILRRRA